MFFGPFDLKAEARNYSLSDLNKREYLMLIPLGAAALAFGIFPQPILDWINPFAQHFVDTVLATGKRLTL
jgi:NADH-quinone oxidoreductase subunit M